jgi:hypothetical protein
MKASAGVEERRQLGQAIALLPRRERDQLVTHIVRKRHA